jgi:uncharacterized protein (DUF1501 family)
MSEQPVFTRRGFLAASMALASAAGTVPLFVEHTALAAEPTTSSSRTRSTPGAKEDRILVIVQLSGGNDGLNTVVPFGQDAYYRYRPYLGIQKRDVLRLGKNEQIGLNPGMGDLRQMYDAGLASIVQGVGYPNPNRSHFASMDIWHTADTNGGRGLGWIGKAMDEHRRANGNKIDPTACVCLGGESPLAAEGKHVKPIAFQNANLFRWAGGDLHPALAKSYDALNTAAVAPEADDATSFVMRTALDAQIASDRIRKAVSSEPATRFPNGSLANEMKMVASMIRAELPTRIYYVGLGGFDTHANQPGGHQRNLEQFSQSVKAFYDELKAIGQDKRVLTLAFSEFGRRVAQNASNGTDHGTAGPTFLFGPMVRPGLIGEHPSLTELDQGDLIYNVDFRSLYATVLEKWMAIDSLPVLGQRFRLANLLA